MRNRKITDVWAAFIYIVVVGIYIIGAILAIKNGDPKRIFAPLNSKGEFCGIEDASKQKLLILDYASLNLAKSISSFVTSRQLMINTKSTCVAACPTLTGAVTPENAYCFTTVPNLNEETLKTAITEGICQAINIPTYDLYGYCIPDMIKMRQSKGSFGELIQVVNINTLFEVLSGSPDIFSKLKIITEAFSDFLTIKYNVFIYVGICYVITLTIILILGFGSFPLFIIFYCIGVCAVSMGFSCSVVAYVATTEEGANNPNIQWIKQRVDTILVGWFKESYLLISIILAIILLMMLYFGIYLAKVVNIACSYARKAGRTTIFLVLNSIVPLITLALQFTIIGFWLYITACIVTSQKNQFIFFYKNADNNIIVGDICKIGSSMDYPENCSFGGMSINTLNKIIFWYMTVVSIWICATFHCVCTYVISYAYYKCYIKREQRFPIDIFVQLFRGIKTLAIYNAGSVIFGSLLITIVSTILLVFVLLQKALGINKKSNGYLSFKLFRNILGFIQRIVIKISERTIIEVVVAKRNFISSAKETIALAVRYPVLTTVINVFNSFYITFGSLISAALTATASYFHVQHFFPDIMHPIGFSVGIGLICIVISSSVLKIFTIGIVTFQYYDCHNNELEADRKELEAKE